MKKFPGIELYIIWPLDKQYAVEWIKLHIKEDIIIVNLHHSSQLWIAQLKIYNVRKARVFLAVSLVVEDEHMELRQQWVVFVVFNICHATKLTQRIESIPEQILIPIQYIHSQ